MTKRIPTITRSLTATRAKTRTARKALTVKKTYATTRSPTATRARILTATRARSLTATRARVPIASITARVPKNVNMVTTPAHVNHNATIMRIRMNYPRPTIHTMDTPIPTLCRFLTNTTKSHTQNHTMLLILNRTTRIRLLRLYLSTKTMAITSRIKTLLFNILPALEKSFLGERLKRLDITTVGTVIVFAGFI